MMVAALMCCKHWNQVMPVVSHIRIFLRVEIDAFNGQVGLFGLLLVGRCRSERQR